MQPNPWMQELRQAIRDELAERLEQTGRARARQIAEAVAAKCPEAFEAAAKELGLDSLTKIARTIAKETSAVDKSTAQRELPFEAQHLAPDLPATIIVPLEGGDFEYRALTGPMAVDNDELDRGIAYLEDQLRKDARRIDALKEYRRIRLFYANRSRPDRSIDDQPPAPL